MRLELSVNDMFSPWTWSGAALWITSASTTVWVVGDVISVTGRVVKVKPRDESLLGLVFRGTVGVGVL